jgi:thiosulfate reductase/polysulfide reductase chain A
VHPNWAIANSPDPINGQQRWMDTVVKVTRV